MEVRFEALRDRRAAVVRLSGPLDLVAAVTLRSRFSSLVAAGFEVLIVDLREVPHADRSGLASLVDGLKATRRAGGDFRIVAPSDRVAQVLRTSGLDAILIPYGTVEDALPATA